MGGDSWLRAGSLTSLTLRTIASQVTARNTVVASRMRPGATFPLFSGGRALESSSAVVVPVEEERFEPSATAC